jgi:hypothetical protein
LVREPTILDWHTGLPLSAAFSSSVLFSAPPADTTALPYLDVIRAASPRTDVYQAVEEGKVWDTQLLHRLYCRN